MPTNKEIDYYAAPIRTQGVVLSILLGVMLVDEVYKSKVNRSLPWALLDRCITTSLWGGGIRSALLKRLRK